MPLIQSSSDKAFKENARNLIHEAKAGTSKHVQSRDQALAIAYSVKRRNRAEGGKLPSTPWFVRNQARGMTHSGAILSAVAGRTDHHPMSVKAGSYVLPADHVSSMGQGNTMSGVAQLSKMFAMGPYGGGTTPLRRGPGAPKAPVASRPPRMRAEGGVADDNEGEPVAINAAGGEFVIPPEKILEWMEHNGLMPDLKAGHAALDQWVIDHRKKHRSTLAKLPGPAKD